MPEFRHHGSLSLAFVVIRKIPCWRGWNCDMSSVWCLQILLEAVPVDFVLVECDFLASLQYNQTFYRRMEQPHVLSSSSYGANRQPWWPTLIAARVFLWLRIGKNVDERCAVFDTPVPLFIMCPWDKSTMRPSCNKKASIPRTNYSLLSYRVAFTTAKNTYR